MSTFLKDSNIGDRMRKFGATGKKKKLRVKKSYQRYFDGYAEYRVPKENGKGEKTVRVYTADYHDADLSGKRKILLRVAHLLIISAGLTIFAFGATINAHFNNVWFGIIPEACATGAFGLGIITLLFRYIPYMRKTTNWEYRQSVVRYTKILRLLPYFLIASTLTALISIAVYPKEYGFALKGAALFLLSGAIMYCGKYLESRVPYILIPSGNTAPVGAVDISTMKEIEPPKIVDENSPGGYSMEQLEFEADDDDTPEPKYW